MLDDLGRPLDAVRLVTGSGVRKPLALVIVQLIKISVARSQFRNELFEISEGRFAKGDRFSRVCAPVWDYVDVPCCIARSGNPHFEVCSAPVSFRSSSER